MGMSHIFHTSCTQTFAYSFGYYIELPSRHYLAQTRIITIHMLALIAMGTDCLKRVKVGDITEVYKLEKI